MGAVQVTAPSSPPRLTPDFAQPHLGDMGKEERQLDDDLDAVLGDDERARRVRTRCPKCDWKPGKHDKWYCRCGTSWNTFMTRGVCPGCTFAWKITQCLKCHAFSAHEDWYTKE